MLRRSRPWHAAGSNGGDLRQFYPIFLNSRANRHSPVEATILDVHGLNDLEAPPGRCLLSDHSELAATQDTTPRGSDARWAGHRAPDAVALMPASRLPSDEQGRLQLPCCPRFAPGDKLHECEGAFSDCIGLHEGMLDSQRVAILLDLLGRKVRVILSPESVVAA
jgi:hypothetical protein